MRIRSSLKGRLEVYIHPDAVLKTLSVQMHPGLCFPSSLHPRSRHLDSQYTFPSVQILVLFLTPSTLALNLLMARERRKILRGSTDFLYLFLRGSGVYGMHLSLWREVHVDCGETRVGKSKVEISSRTALTSTPACYLDAQACLSASLSVGDALSLSS